MAVNPFTMQPTDNPFFDPANLLAMSAGMLQGPDFATGAGNALATLSTNVAAAKEKQTATQQENRTRAALQKLYPDQDLSALQGQDLHDLLVETQKRRMFPAAPEFKTLADGTFGTWDGKTFNRLGRAENPNDMPSEFRNFQEAQKNPAFAEFLKSKSPTNQTYEDRLKIAKDLGMTPEDPAYDMFVATGKFPREDQQRLTAGDKAQLYELQDKIDTNKTAIASLKSLITPPKPGESSLNDRAGSGYTAGTQSFLARNDPTGWFDDQQGEATTEFRNVIKRNTLDQLKATFGGNPTEGERAVLEEIEASVDKTPAERKIIIDRAIALAERRLQMAEERAASIRDESFYQPGGNKLRPATTNSGKTKTGIGFTVEP